MFTLAIGAANFYKEVFGFFLAAKRRKKREKGNAGGARRLASWAQRRI
jgi:hypothetical protein